MSALIVFEIDQTTLDRALFLYYEVHGRNKRFPILEPMRTMPPRQNVFASYFFEEDQLDEHRALMELPAAKNAMAISTENFDNLLEFYEWMVRETPNSTVLVDEEFATSIWVNFGNSREEALFNLRWSDLYVR